MSQIAIPSSGDPELDRERLEDFARFDALIETNQCPNGHGEMFIASERRRECLDCGFVHTTVQINV